jgi:hypothetical protein
LGKFVWGGVCDVGGLENYVDPGGHETSVNSIGKRLCSPPPLHPKFRVSQNYQLNKQHQTINTRKEFLKKQSVDTT